MQLQPAHFSAPLILLALLAPALKSYAEPDTVTVTVSPYEVPQGTDMSGTVTINGAQYDKLQVTLTVIDRTRQSVNSAKFDQQVVTLNKNPGGSCSADFTLHVDTKWSIGRYKVIAMLGPGLYRAAQFIVVKAQEAKHIPTTNEFLMGAGASGNPGGSGNTGGGSILFGLRHSFQRSTFVALFNLASADTLTKATDQTGALLNPENSSRGFDFKYSNLFLPPRNQPSFGVYFRGGVHFAQWQKEASKAADAPTPAPTPTSGEVFYAGAGFEVLQAGNASDSGGAKKQFGLGLQIGLGYRQLLGELANIKGDSKILDIKHTAFWGPEATVFLTLGSDVQPFARISDYRYSDTGLTGFGGWQAVIGLDAVTTLFSPSSGKKETGAQGGGSAGSNSNGGGTTPGASGGKPLSLPQSLLR